MPQQDVWKPISSPDWVPISTPKPLDTRLKDPITQQPKTDILEPFKGMPLNTLENIKFDGPPTETSQIPKEHSWGDQAVAMGLRTVPTIAGGIVGGAFGGGPIGMMALGGAGATLGEGWARDYLGQEPNAAAELTEGVIGGITAPFGPALPGIKEGFKAVLPYAAKNAVLGGVTEGISSIPRHVAETGKWELPSLSEAGTQAAFGAGFGGLTGGALGAGHQGVGKLGNYKLSIESGDLPSNDVLSRSQLDTSTQVQLFEKGLSHEEISKITPEEANNILGGGAGHVRPSVINPEVVAGIRQQARNVEPPPPIVEQGAPSTTQIQTPASAEPVPYTAGQDLSWPEKPSTEVVNQLASEGMEPYQDNGGNWFFRLIKEESGHLDPVLLWKNVRRYFENPDPSEDVNTWRQALVRAAAAGDMEATNIINARVRELEQQQGVSHTTPPELVEPMVNAPSTNEPVRTMADHVAEAEAAGATPRQVTPPGESEIQYYDTNQNRLEIENAARNPEELQHLIEYWGNINQEASSRSDAELANHSFEMINIAETALEDIQVARGISNWVPEPDSANTPQQQMEATTNALANEAASQSTIIPVNHIWEAWDLQDRWHDLRNAARAAGDRDLQLQMQDQIYALDARMNDIRNNPNTGIEVADPTPFEQANAHLSPPSTPSTFGAGWSQDLRDRLIRYAAERQAQQTGQPSPPPAINTPFASMPRPDRRWGSRDVIQQQMQDLGITPDREQWYRGLNDESLEFPEEGTQPIQRSLGLDEEIDPVSGLTNAQISELDPNFTPKEYAPPSEGEGRYQPRLKLREEPWYTEADIDELEVSMNNAMDNGLGLSYGVDQVRHLPNGRPGLEVKSSGGSYWDAIYRDANGKPVATASGSTRGISNLGAEVKKPRAVGATTQENKGIGTGRPVYAVLRGLTKKGVPLLVNSSLSPYSKAMVQSFIKQARRLLTEETGSLSLDPEVWKEGWKNLSAKTGWGMGRSGDTPFKFSDVIEGKAREKEEGTPNIFKEIVTTPTVASTVSDMSGAGRQGLSQILTPEFWKAAKDMYKGAWTPALFDKVDAEVRNLPLFKEYRDPTTGKLIPSKGEKMGIKISAPGHRLGPREEGTASRWIETGGMFGPQTIGGYNNPVRSAYKHTLGVGARISNRGLTTFLNVLRANRAQKLMDLAAGMANEGMRTGSMPMEGVLGGMKMPDFLGGEHIGFKQKVSMEEAAEKNPYLNDVLAREIGDFVNTATGRGPLKTHILPFKQAELSLEGAADKLGYALFSPRNFAAKARMMNPSTYVMASPFVRKQYLKAILSTGMAWYTFTELAKLADPDVEVNYDLTNADFGKVRIGDFRMDPAGGFQQFLVLYSRLMAGGTTSSASNRFRKFGSGPTAETAKSTIERFGANKLNPVARFAYDFASASKRQPFQVMDRTMQMYLPLVAQDAYEIYKEDPDLFPWLLPIAHGWGSQIYGKEVNQGRFIDKKNDFTITGGGPMDWMGLNK